MKSPRALMHPGAFFVVKLIDYGCQTWLAPPSHGTQAPVV